MKSLVNTINSNPDQYIQTNHLMISKTYHMVILSTWGFSKTYVAKITPVGRLHVIDACEVSKDTNEIDRWQKGCVGLGTYIRHFGVKQIAELIERGVFLNGWEA